MRKDTNIFIGDFLKPNTEYLTLTNTSSGPLAFKVKTTAPKLYSVRPNANIIKPGDSIKISINLQAFSQPLSKFYKCKDKFLIVALPCSVEADASKVSEFWNDLEKSNKSKLISNKLKVNYIIEDDGDAIKEEKIDDEPAEVVESKPEVIATGISTSDDSGLKSVKQPEEISEKKDYDEESYNEINKLSEKFDKTESEETKVIKKDEPFGVSLILTVILMLLAFIIGWLIF